MKKFNLKSVPQLINNQRHKQISFAYMFSMKNRRIDTYNEKLHIPQTKSTKYVGIVIDEHLKWDMMLHI